MQDGLSNLRRKMSRCADARALGLTELEKFLAEVAREWNSVPFVDGVAEFAQQVGNVGVATWGINLRELDQEILRGHVGMSAVHAKRFEGGAQVLCGVGQSLEEDTLEGDLYDHQGEAVLNAMLQQEDSSKAQQQQPILI